VPSRPGNRRHDLRSSHPYRQAVSQPHGHPGNPPLNHRASQQSSPVGSHRDHRPDNLQALPQENRAVSPLRRLRRNRLCDPPVNRLAHQADSRPVGQQGNQRADRQASLAAPPHRSRL
jgi:hypothetical protein